MLIKYIYLSPKGPSQEKVAKKKSEEARKIFEEFKSLYQTAGPSSSSSLPQDFEMASVPVGRLYAARSHQPDAGPSSDAASLPKYPKLQRDIAKGSSSTEKPIEPPVCKAIPPVNKAQKFMGLFYRLVMKNKMPIETLMLHFDQIPTHLQSWASRRVKSLYKPTDEKKEKKYFELPEGVGIKQIKNNTDLHGMISILSNEKIENVGIDTESNVFYNSLELIQISTLDECYLIRKKYVDEMSKKLMEELGKVLAKKLVIYFAGGNDSILLSDFIPNCELNRVLDLQKLVQEVGFTVLTDKGEPKQLVSLSDCIKEWLGGLPLDKKLTCSNWYTEGELTHEQTVYAAIDAYVLVRLYDEIRNDPRYKGNIKKALRSAQFLSQHEDNICDDDED